jgi:predicted DCC family thiol-disulfide oxidoreductase YuxK
MMARQSREPSLILFDGHCNLCSGSVNWIIDRDPAGRFVFASLQSEPGRRTLERFELDPLRTDSVVLVEGDRAYTRSTAALRIARRLTFPWPVLSLLAVVPAGIRDGVYDVIARHRYRWFGRSETCRMPTPELQARFVG